MQKDSSFQHDATLQYILRTLHGAVLDAAAIETLALDIRPYLARTRLPFEDAVRVISTNYLTDGARVRCLLATSDADEWQDVLEHVVTFAASHSYFPKDTEAISWPDLDAYEDVRRKLQSYNFEGALDNWITVTVVKRLHRYWRDQQALSAGGAGLVPAAQREAEYATGRSATRAARQYSLDTMLTDDQGQVRLESPEPPLSELVESVALREIVSQEVQGIAVEKNDPMLPFIWRAIVEHQLKLRETADQLDMSISQVHRRMELIRGHLRQSPRIRQWFDGQG